MITEENSGESNLLDKNENRESDQNPIYSTSQSKYYLKQREIRSYLSSSSVIIRLLPSSS
jgi:hypothetical protein